MLKHGIMVPRHAVLRPK